MHNPKLFVASSALSLEPEVIHVIHNIEMFITSKALNT